MSDMAGHYAGGRNRERIALHKRSILRRASAPRGRDRVRVARHQRAPGMLGKPA
jgi:hypothetical protein